MRARKASTRSAATIPITIVLSLLLLDEAALSAAFVLAAPVAEADDADVVGGMDTVAEMELGVTREDGRTEIAATEAEVVCCAVVVGWVDWVLTTEEDDCTTTD